MAKNLIISKQLEKTPAQRFNFIQEEAHKSFREALNFIYFKKRNKLKIIKFSGRTIRLKKDQVIFSNDKLAKRFGLSKTRVFQIIQILIAIGLLKKIEGAQYFDRNGKPKGYTIVEFIDPFKKQKKIKLKVLKEVKKIKENIRKNTERKKQCLQVACKKVLENTTERIQTVYNNNIYIPYHYKNIRHIKSIKDITVKKVIMDGYDTRNLVKSRGQEYLNFIINSVVSSKNVKNQIGLILHRIKNATMLSFFDAEQKKKSKNDELRLKREQKEKLLKEKEEKALISKETKIKKLHKNIIDNSPDKYQDIINHLEPKLKKARAFNPFKDEKLTIDSEIWFKYIYEVHQNKLNNLIN